MYIYTRGSNSGSGFIRQRMRQSRIFILVRLMHKLMVVVKPRGRIDAKPLTSPRHLSTLRAQNLFRCITCRKEWVTMSFGIACTTVNRRLLCGALATQNALLINRQRVNPARLVNTFRIMNADNVPQARRATVVHQRDRTRVVTLSCVE